MNRASKILLLLLIISCNKEEPLGKGVPEIAYIGFSKISTSSGKDTAVLIRFNFKDTDGDIGFREEDTIPPLTLPENRFNLRAEFICIENGMEVQYLLQPMNTDTFNYNQRILNLTPEGKYKSISGSMELNADFSLLPILIGVQPDSVKFRISISDRALQRSNVIETPVIQLNL